MAWPLDVSNDTYRCAPPACWPQRYIRPLTITWFPSITGDDTRPPCVVHIPNSSASERSQSSLPAGENDISSPLPLNAKTLPVAGSTAGEAQAMRCGGTSLVKRLYLCSQSSFPVSALKHISRSCSIGPEPDAFCRYR